MTKRQKETLQTYKNVLEDRLSHSGMLTFLIGTLFYSGVTVGVAYYAANVNTVGWENLSPIWHNLFYIEGILLVFHVLVILISLLKFNWVRVFVSFSMIPLTYKVSLDPYLTMLMISIEAKIYENVAPYVFTIIACGILFHIILLIQTKKNEFKHQTSMAKKEKSFSVIGYFPVFLTLATFVTLLVRNISIGNLDIIFMLFIFTVLYFIFLYQVIEYILVAYLLLKFPELRNIQIIDEEP